MWNTPMYPGAWGKATASAKQMATRHAPIKGRCMWKENPRRYISAPARTQITRESAIIHTVCVLFSRIFRPCTKESYSPNILSLNLCGRKKHSLESTFLKKSGLITIKKRETMVRAPTAANTSVHFFREGIIDSLTVCVSFAESWTTES